MPVDRRPGFCVDCGSKPSGPKSKSRCDSCATLQTERTRRYNERNREKIRERERERAKDPAHLAHRAEITARYRDRNPEKAKLAVMVRRTDPKSKTIDAKARRIYLERKRLDPQWVAEQRAYRLPLYTRRRARKKNAEGHFTAWQWRALCASYGHRCAYCGDVTKLTVDHIIPLARGGSNYLENVIPACQPCNSRKNTKTAEEFCQQSPLAT